MGRSVIYLNFNEGFHRIIFLIKSSKLKKDNNNISRIYFTLDSRLSSL